jgi:hypothetical protein
MPSIIGHRRYARETYPERAFGIGSTGPTGPTGLASRVNAPEVVTHASGLVTLASGSFTLFDTTAGDVEFVTPADPVDNMRVAIGDNSGANGGPGGVAHVAAQGAGVTIQDVSWLGPPNPLFVAATSFAESAGIAAWRYFAPQKQWVKDT